jgi:hypothetical protein
MTREETLKNFQKSVKIAVSFFATNSNLVGAIHPKEKKIRLNICLVNKVLICYAYEVTFQSPKFQFSHTIDNNKNKQH